MLEFYLNIAPSKARFREHSLSERRMTDLQEMFGGGEEIVRKIQSLELGQKSKR